MLCPKQSEVVVGYKAKQSQVVVHEDRKAKCHLRGL
jgi:hypothetical protein